MYGLTERWWSSNKLEEIPSITLMFLLGAGTQGKTVKIIAEEALQIAPTRVSCRPRTHSPLRTPVVAHFTLH